MPPYGEDLIVVYASEAPLGEVAMKSIGRGLRQYRGLQKDLAFQTRGIKVVKSDTGSDTGADFYESTWKLRTIPSGTQGEDTPATTRDPEK